VSLLLRHPLRTAVALVGAIALFAVAGSAIVVWRSAHDDDASEVQTADAIVVLGAAQYGGEPSPVFRERLDHALMLFRQGRADRVVVLGSKAAGDQTTEADAGRDYLIGRGVPAAAAIAVPVGRTTFESLAGAARYMKRRGLDSAFLVSDPWHNARIERMASDLGIEAYASATWTSAARTTRTRFAGYARETFAYLYYRIFGR